MECIPQSADCASEVLTKVKSVATVALNAATAGVFGELLKASEAIQLGVKCGQKLFTATSSLVSYVDELQANETQSQQLLSLVNQSDLVVNELPAAVCTCLGIAVNTDNLEMRAEVANAVKQLVTTAIEDGTSLLNPSNFLAFIKDLGVDDSVQDLDKDSLAQLQDVLTSGATCGTKLQAIINKVTQFVVDATSGNPEGGKIVLHVKIHDEEDDDSSANGSGEAGVEQKDGSKGGSGTESVTPVPTTANDEDQIDQSPLSSSGNGDDISFPPTPTATVDDNATPAPTTLGDGSVTPSPTTPDSADPTQQISEDTSCQS
ncbi:hypothetical protein PI124_g3368 [Phytophthora idaei]|nr:hypothetical protein PI124_g3368 [Phytophthora idaei]